MTKLSKLMGDYLPPALLIAAAIGFWEAAIPIFKVADYILPKPSQIVSEFFVSLGLLMLHSWVTLKEILLGFILGDIVGILLAILIVQFKFLERSLYPVIVLFQTVPKVAIAPIFILWFGYGDVPKILIIILISFFPVVVNTIAGIESVEPSLIDILKSVSASRWQILYKIQLPHSLPHIFAGLKIAITFSVIGAIVAEWAGADKGLGFQILYSSSVLDTKLLFAAITAISIMGVVLFYIVGLIERVLLPWRQQKGGVITQI